MRDVDSSVKALGVVDGVESVARDSGRDGMSLRTNLFVGLVGKQRRNIAR